MGNEFDWGTGGSDEKQEQQTPAMEIKNSAFFSYPNVPAMLKSVGLKLHKEKDETERRVAECTFSIFPLPAQLAESISPKLAEHVFNFDGLKDSERAGAPPRSEITDITFAIGIGLQHMNFLSHPELPNSGAYIQNVSVDKIRVKRAKAGEVPLELSFMVSFDLDVETIEVKAHLIVVLLGRTAYLTFKSAAPFLGEE